VTLVILEISGVTFWGLTVVEIVLSAIFDIIVGLTVVVGLVADVFKMDTLLGCILIVLAGILVKYTDTPLSLYYKLQN
jgi:hypothetical protein